jgi:hypothetical protein
MARIHRQQSLPSIVADGALDDRANAVALACHAAAMSDAGNRRADGYNLPARRAST